MDEPIVKALSDAFVQTLNTNPVSNTTQLQLFLFDFTHNEY